LDVRKRICEFSIEYKPLESRSAIDRAPYPTSNIKHQTSKKRGRSRADMN